MKNVKINRIFISIFLVLCLVPAVGMLVFGPSDAAANEVLSSKPKLTDKDGNLNTDLLSDFSDYFADRFYLRRECINTWAVINTGIFKTSVDDSVILGKNNTLYYSETLDDYMGIGLSDGQLETVAENLSLIQEYVQSTGADFVFTVAPNKNSLYPDNMPSFIPSNHSSSNAERIAEILTEHGVTYADLFAAFNLQSEILYYCTDSHWNSKGAALGADTILAEAGIVSDYYHRSFTSGEAHKGDLYEMLYPTGKLTETDLQPDPVLSFTTASSTNSGKALAIHSTGADAEGTLVCWRDSFGNALYPFLADSFATASFYREATYDLTRLIEENPDTVVIELVERNIDWLVTYVPLLPSPERTVAPQKYGEAVNIETENGKNNAETYIHITCELDLSQYEEGTPAYITVNDISYEAYITYLNENSIGLSVWIPNQELTSVEAISFNNGVLTAYPCNF